MARTGIHKYRKYAAGDGFVEHGARMIVEERGPGLGRQTTAGEGDVATNGARRHRQTELETELRGDALLTPRAIGGCHPGDESLEFDGYARPTTRT